jgi:hypothetical protein
MSTNPILTSSATYALVLEGATGSGYFVIRQQNTGNLYLGGMRLISTNSGSSWTSDTGSDIAFEIYGTTGTGSTYNTYLTNSMTLTSIAYTQKTTSSTNNIHPTNSTILIDTVSTYKSGASQGEANKDTFWVNNNGTWVEFDHYDYFKIKKSQNQISEFEVKIYDISPTQKLYFKEQSEVLIFCGTTMVLKGRIQTIEYGDAYEVIARGFGMEVKLLDKELIAEAENAISDKQPVIISRVFQGEGQDAKITEIGLMNTGKAFDDFSADPQVARG